MDDGTANTEGEPMENIMKILVASDIHLGYLEKDSIRGEDSFTAFEEILQHAVQENVDFILLGGDLFHDANPTQNSLNKCLKLLRRYTLGDKAIELEFLSDQSLNFFDSLNQTVNYQDPNLNISIPVFSIHGNHDDPSGFGRLSTLDLLSNSGLINYFGKWIDLTKIELNPIMLRKGTTQLALYGLSHIHDARLARLFLDSKVVLERPEESSGLWFNMLVLHQNRADRGVKNYLPENCLPEFLDFVIWGHEHDCRIWPEGNGNFFVCQPGSSVATSLSEGESIPKHCAVLEILGESQRLKPIPLKTVRPFIFESINLIDYIEDHGLDEVGASEKVWEIAKEKVESMLVKAKEKLTDDLRQPKIPLLRLRIFHTNEDQMFSPIRFGQQYNERVANPMDMILFKRVVRKPKFGAKGVDQSAMDTAFEEENITTETRVEDIVDRYFESVDASKQLQVISSRSLSELCRRLVESNDDDAADNIIKFYKTAANSFLLEKLAHEDDINEELAKFREKANEIHDAALKSLDNRGNVRKIPSNISFLSDDDEKELSDNAPAEKSNKAVMKDKPVSVASASRGAARGGRGKGGGRGRGRGAAAAPKVELDISIDNKKVSKQPILADTMSISRRAGRSKPKVVYEISDSD